MGSTQKGIPIQTVCSCCRMHTSINAFVYVDISGVVLDEPVQVIPVDILRDLCIQVDLERNDGNYGADVFTEALNYVATRML
jgi:hypothetical protein